MPKRTRGKPRAFRLSPINIMFSNPESTVSDVSERDVLVSNYTGVLSRLREPFTVDVIRDYEELSFNKTVRRCPMDTVMLTTAEKEAEHIVAPISSGPAEVRRWDVEREHTDCTVLKSGIYCKAYTIGMLADELPPGWIYGIYSKADAVRMFVNPIPPEKRHSVVASHMASSSTDSSASGVDVAASARAIKEMITGNQTSLYTMRIIPLVFALDYQKLRERARVFEADMRGVPGVETARHVQSQMLAGEQGQQMLAITETFAALVPFSTSELYEDGGILLGVNTVTGNPFRWNINNRINRNTVLAALSGSGKTTLAMMIIHAFDRMYPEAFIFGIDPESEYRALGDSMGFTYLDYSTGKQMGLDLFRMVPDAFAASETLCDALLIPEEKRMPANMAATDMSNMPMEERSFFRFVDAVEKHTEPEDRQVLGQFRMLCHHPYEDFFRGMAPDTKRVILSLKNVGSAGGTVHRLITQIALSYALGRSLMMSKTVPKLFMLDEVWMLLQHGPLGDYIQHLSRRGRKYNINMLMATQNIEDMTANEAARNVLVNSDTVMFLRQSEATSRALNEHFVLSGEMSNWLMRMRRGQALVRFGNSVVPVDVLPDQEQLELFRPR